MISKIICLIVIVIVLVIVVFSNKTKELFHEKEAGEEIDVTYTHVDPNDYSCLSSCIIEQGATVNFCEPAFEWNHANPDKGYCHTVNDKKFPFVCKDDTCINKCGPLNNEYDPDADTLDPIQTIQTPEYGGGSESILNIDPINDYSRCVNTKYGCIEHKLNNLSSGCWKHTTKCKQCIANFKPNIDTLWKIVKDTIENETKCDATTAADAATAADAT